MPPKPLYRMLDVTNLGLAPRSRLDNSTLGATITAGTSALASIPSGETVILILNGLDGGSSDLSVWRDVADALPLRILLAIVESFPRLRRDICTAKQLGPIDFFARLEGGWDVLSEPGKFCAIFELDQLLQQALLQPDQRDPHYHSVLTAWSWYDQNRVDAVERVRARGVHGVGRNRVGRSRGNY